MGDAFAPNALDGHFCGGTLIAPLWVVTAAHCVEGLNPLRLKVILGRHRLTSEDGEELEVAAIVIHPGWNPVNLDNDIALVRLATPATVTPISWVTLAEASRYAPGIEAVATGWGAQSSASNANASDVLLEVNLPIVANEIAEPDGDEVTKNMLAAGFASGNQDTCPGDSGGPLVVPGVAVGDDGRLVGITSWGPGRCGESRFAFYTRVANYAHWIEARLAETTPPINDDFAHRITITGASVTVHGLNLNASLESEEPLHPDNVGGKSLWWSWTAPATGLVTASTSGSNTDPLQGISNPNRASAKLDTLLAVYAGDALSSLTLIADNDDFLGKNSRVTFLATAGSAYQVAVDGYNGVAGAITLTIDQGRQRPANDRFAQRLATFGAQTIGTNVNATKETNERDHAGDAGGKSVWWTWTAPSSGDTMIDTHDSDRFDTLLGVYTGSSLSSLFEVDSNDDDLDNGLKTSRVGFDASAGVSYQIAVDGYNDESGNIVLTLTRGDPLNDDFLQRLPLTGIFDGGTGTNEFATVEGLEPFHADNDGGSSVWWTWIAPASGVVTVSTHDSDFDTLLGVYTGNSIATLSTVVSNDDDGDSQQSLVSFTASAGSHYHIAVDGYLDMDSGDVATGEINLTVALGPHAPANDQFSQAATLTGAPIGVFGSNVHATRQSNEPEYLQTNGGRSVWWQWTAPQSGVTILDTQGSDFDTILGVYTGDSLAALTPIASNDDVSNQLTSQATFLATRGTTYRFGVAGYKRVSGDIQLNLCQFVALCQSFATSLGDDGTVAIDVASIDNGSAADCGEIVSKAVHPNTFACAQIGDRVVTLTVTDVHGNSATCTAVVTVTDDTPPAPACRALTVPLNLTGTTTIAAEQIDNGSYDPCGISDYALDPSTFDCDDTGDNLVTLTVSDPSGNTAVCTTIVTVDDRVEFPLSLHPEWNLISFPFMPDIQFNLLDFKALGGPLWTTNPRHYFIAEDHIRELAGYWFHCERAAPVTVSGSLRCNPTYHLRAGWNLVGAPMEVAARLPDDWMGPIYQWNGEYLEPAPGSGDRIPLQMGRGYWIFCRREMFISMTSDYFVIKERAGENLEYRLYNGDHHFLSVIHDPHYDVITRPHPGIDPNGWGTSVHLRPFLPGATLGHGRVDAIVVKPDGVTLTMNGHVSRDADNTFGSWQLQMKYDHRATTRKIGGSGDYAITLDGRLTDDTGDLNLAKIASNLLKQVPLLSGGIGNTGDMMAVMVTGDHPLDWDPATVSDPGYFPVDEFARMRIIAIGNYNEVDTQAQGFAPIAPAYKPTVVLTFIANDSESAIRFGAFYDLSRSADFAADNVGITPLVFRGRDRQTFNYTIEFESTALAGDGN